MYPRDAFSEIILEKTKKWLEMDTKQFEDNVLASPLAMKIIRRTLDVGSSDVSIPVKLFHSRSIPVLFHGME
ncbi:unnamed protein product [Anisakis simplex]|uniref:Methylthioribose-1-phosphate isomerase n=1 Tax=Anisakis simplex TaxID=6269 RepID=A0A0M3JLN1_ANISI|nr:unnamed protein product [Anisakis simplex]